MKLITKFDIEDAVFTVSAGNVTKRIIKIIKITGDDEIKYGFESNNTFSFYGSDSHIWFDEDEVFENKSDAKSSKVSKKQELKKKCEELKEELESVEEDLDDFDD